MNQADSISTQEILTGINDPAHIITLLAIMILAGLLGGTAGYMIENNTTTDSYNKYNKKVGFYILIGTCASFLVPLFMTTISSDLLENSQQNHLDYLVFGGFCLIASISAHKFITSISDKILKQVDSARDEIAATENRIQKRIGDTEQKKNIDKELSYLSANIQRNQFEDFTREKAFSILDKTLTLTTQEEKTFILYELISLYFTAGKYELINEVIENYSDKLSTDAYTWANIAIANMNLYSKTLNNIYKKKSIEAARNSMKLHYTYGEPYAILIYLYLIDYAAEQTKEGKEKAVESIKGVFKDLDDKTQETSHSAYQYFLKNQDSSFKKYNDILQKIMPDKFQTLKQRAGEGELQTGNETKLNLAEE